MYCWVAAVTASATIISSSMSHGYYSLEESNRSASELFSMISNIFEVSIVEDRSSSGFSDMSLLSYYNSGMFATSYLISALWSTSNFLNALFTRRSLEKMELPILFT